MMKDLSLRLDIASDDLATMRADLAGAGDLPVAGRGSAARLVAELELAWSERQKGLASLSGELAELAVGVRTAADRYRAAEQYSDVDGAR